MLGDFTWPYYQQTFWSVPLWKKKKKEGKTPHLPKTLLETAEKSFKIYVHNMAQNIPSRWSYNHLGGLFPKCSVDQIEDTRGTQI